ncbi:unnamed protein product [Hymenolepis diminuta]|uniref:Sister chromatid cohesion protein n=1 Tax=Hymenolepis diminuta TaxID=6216 RepID=A0A0R3SE80_HYMDI|nr:unnamed protein product [Hymenolepis diminuta]VUZ52959.1 unnamed protein product [Hymenolepis diminuta]
MPLKIQGRQAFKQKVKSNLNTSNGKDWKAYFRLNSEENWDATDEINVNLIIPKSVSSSKSKKEHVKKISVRMPLPNLRPRIKACNVSISACGTDIQPLACIKSQNGVFPVKTDSQKYLSSSKSLKTAKISRRIQKSSHISIKKTSSGNIEGKIEVVKKERGYDIQRENSPENKEFLNDKKEIGPLEPISSDRTGVNEKEDITIKESALEENILDGIQNQPTIDFYPTPSLDKESDQYNYQDENVDKLALTKVELPKPSINEVPTDENVDNFISTQIIEGDQGLNILLNMQLFLPEDKFDLIQERFACLLEELEVLFKNDFSKKPAELPSNNLPQYLTSTTQEESPTLITNFLETPIVTSQNESFQNELTEFFKEMQEFDNDTQKEVIFILKEIVLVLETLKHCEPEKQFCNLDQNVKSTPRLRCLIAQLKSAIQPLHPNPPISERTDVAAELGCLLDVLREILRNGYIDYENLVNTAHILCYIDDEFQQQGSFSNPLDVNIRKLLEIINAKLIHSSISSKNPNEERMLDTSNPISPTIIDAGKSVMGYQNEQYIPTPSANFVNSPVALVIAKFHELVQNLEKELSGVQESTVEKLLSTVHQIGAILTSNSDNIRQVNEIKDTLDKMEQKMIQSNSECLEVVSRLFFCSIIDGISGGTNQPKEHQRKKDFKKLKNFLKHQR